MRSLSLLLLLLLLLGRRPRTLGSDVRPISLLIESPCQDLLTQTFREIPYRPENSTW